MARQKTLVGERRDDGDDGDGEKCADAIQGVEARHVVEKKFQQGDTQQGDGGVAGAGGFSPDPEGEEAEGEERPADRVLTWLAPVIGRLGCANDVFPKSRLSGRCT